MGKYSVLPELSNCLLDSVGILPYLPMDPLKLGTGTVFPVFASPNFSSLLHKYGDNRHWGPFPPCHGHGWQQISSSEEEWPTSGSSSASSWSVVPARAKSGLALQRTGTPPHNQTSWLLLSEWGNMGQKWHSCQNCNGKNQGWFGAVQGAYRRWQGKEGRGEHRISWAEEVHFLSVFSSEHFPHWAQLKRWVGHHSSQQLRNA